MKTKTLLPLAVLAALLFPLPALAQDFPGAVVGVDTLPKPGQDLQVSSTLTVAIASGTSAPFTVTVTDNSSFNAAGYMICGVSGGLEVLRYDSKPTGTTFNVVERSVGSPAAADHAIGETCGVGPAAFIITRLIQEVIAIEAELGVDPAGASSTVVARFGSFDADTLSGIFTIDRSPDPSIRWDVSGTQVWALGVDTSDSDAYVLSSGTGGVASNIVMSMTATGTTISWPLAGATIGPEGYAHTGTNSKVELRRASAGAGEAWVSYTADGVVRWEAGLEDGSADYIIRYLPGSADDVVMRFTAATAATILSDLTVLGNGPHAFGGAVVGNNRMDLAGSFTSDGTSNYSTLLNLDGALTTATGIENNVGGVRLNASITTGATGGVIPIAYQLRLDEPDITIGTTTITDAATLYIQDAPTEGTTANYALLINSGDAQMGGAFIVFSSSAPVTVTSGSMYFDTDTNELCVYNGTVWTGLIGGGACA